MKKATLVVSDFFLNDRIFDLNDPIANRDDCLYGFYCLKEKLKEIGFSLATQDKHPVEESDLVFYNDMPKKNPINFSKSYLLLFESEIIRKDNWDLKRHSFFKKIFTWKSDLVDNLKYYKINFPIKINPYKLNISFDKKKLACLISAHKEVFHPLELYSERRKTITWFEQHRPSFFDYYGFGWEYFYLPALLVKVLKKTKLLRLFPKKKTLCYQGVVNNKFKTLAHYKFCICYENARDIPGYITEKILDCFLAGCVPIYWGASDIEEVIPTECYIDRKAFKDHTSLFNFLNDMTFDQYQKYQEAIKSFLEQEAPKVFSAEMFAENILKVIKNDFR
ncbi:MAG: hypothetical protein KBD63_00975 [Bacteriovoracaceae bacterium]|nr:hypothetical protein [Bacteriovoracaceae bacterium]